MSQVVKVKPVFSCVAEGDGFALLRDGVLWQTPAGRPFILPKQAAVESIVLEVQAQQQGKPDPAAMPFTQLAATAIDLVAPALAVSKASLVQAVDNELLCHRADAPPALVERQTALWQSQLDWAAKRYDVSWIVGTGIMPVRQAAQTVAGIQRVCEGFDVFTLTGLRHAAGLTGSVVLALALYEGAISVETAFNAAELETLFQIEQWGEDEEASARLQSLRRDIQTCADWFGLLSARA